MRDILDKAIAVLKAAPTYLTAIAVIAGILVDELPNLPVDLPGWVLMVLGGIITTIAVATAIVRRVTPVLEQARGVLPPPTGTPTTPRELELANRVAELEELLRGP